MDNKKIDFVLLWVDDKDIEWQKSKNRYMAEDVNKITSNKYRDFDNLKYWFRGVEKFAPWVNQIFLLTCNQKPEWLNEKHPKLKLVNHTDFIREEYLPTFNSHTIELNFHRIKGLSEHFVYFNDDFFIINHVKQDDFFVNRTPKDMLALQPVVANVDNPVMPYIYLKNSMVLAKLFDKRDNF